MGDFPEREAIILVAIMPAVRDLEIARLLGWYRIPLRKAPKVVDVDYLAFYQTGAFGQDHRWRVEYFAPVKGHEMTTRRELFRDEVDHPRANDEYFRISLGPLQALSNPVAAGNWRRLTFLYTTGERLLGARTLTDLVVRDDERQLLWRSLRERAQRSSEYRVEDWPAMELDPEILMLLGALTG